MFDAKEKLETYLKAHGLDYKWIKQDKYGFSRNLVFTAHDTVCEIEWFTNYSTIIIDGVAHYWFDRLDDSNTYPMAGEWLEFKLGQENHGLHLRIR